MTAAWKREGDRLVIEQKSGMLWILRLIIGGPLLAFGTPMLWLTVTEPVHRFGEGGWSAVFGWLPSTLFSLVFAALTAPMGWWILFYRGMVIVDPASRQLLEVKDWRMGRKVRAHNLNDYRKVSVECDYLLSVKESRSAGNTLANYVRLIPQKEGFLPLQVAIFPHKERTGPEELGRLVSEMIQFPLVMNLDEIVKHRAHDEDEEAGG